MTMEKGKNTWLCINCGNLLGYIFGGELNVDSTVRKFRTNGANLVIYCNECNQQKTFYTSDPIVRAVYQLVSAISDVAAKAMIDSVGSSLNKK